MIDKNTLTGNDEYSEAVLNSFIDKDKYRANEKYAAKLIANDAEDTMRKQIRIELSTCSSYTFAVAFITDGALISLKAMLVDNDICISSALEDYLESIYEISKQKTSVRITDIALALKISKPSVNRAVNTLKKQGLVSHEPYGDIILTEKGFELGEAVYHRHTMIKKFLVNVLHIPEDDAEKEACQIEHNISQNTVEKMKSFMEN